MDASQDTFMSSTMWTERVGFTAALKTIDILTRDKVWEHLIKIGDKIGQGWKILAEKHGLKIEVTDFKPLVSMKFKYGDRNLPLITLFIQEMLERGYLAASSVYVSMAHTENIVENYLNTVDKVFPIIVQAFEKREELKLLKSKPRSDAFQRLTP